MAAKTSAPKTMNEEARLKKNAQIRAAGMATRARRALMDCRVRDLKIVANRLSRAQKTALRAVFLESKWIRNAALAAERFDVGYAKELGDSASVRLLWPQRGQGHPCRGEHGSPRQALRASHLGNRGQRRWSWRQTQGSALRAS